MKKGAKKQKPFTTELSDIDLLRAILPQDEQAALKKGSSKGWVKRNPVDGSLVKKK